MMALLRTWIAGIAAWPPFAYVRVALRLAPYAAIAGLVVALLVARADLGRVRAADKLALAQRHLEDAKARLADAERVTSAVSGYVARQAALQPIILHSIETVTRYAQTPGGRVHCLDADRVRGIDDLDASIRVAAPPGGSAAPLPADAGS